MLGKVPVVANTTSPKCIQFYFYKERKVIIKIEIKTCLKDENNNALGMTTVKILYSFCKYIFFFKNYFSQTNLDI